MLCAAWWSRTSPRNKNNVMRQLVLHTVFLALGMSIKIKFMMMTLIKLLGIEQALAWIIPKIPNS